MRVVLAPDSFGGSLSAAAAARAMAEGWRRRAPAADLRLVPLSDGGPGLLEVLLTALPDATLVPVTARDPLGRPVTAGLLLDGPQGAMTAYVESAQACGLDLLRAAERDPTVTTTYGVGQLVLAALDAGATRIVLGLGGSATNDGGAGMLAALGVTRVDQHGDPVTGGPLLPAHALVGAVDHRLAGVELVAATDVDARLLGLRGATATFAAQKGADEDQQQRLEAAMTRWADLLEGHLGVKVRDRAGAGAAGGLAAALLALGARREPGIALVSGLVGLAEHVLGADLVVTGEGTFDVTSMTGKVVSGVAQAAAREAVPVVVLAGRVELGRREVAAAGVEAAYALVDLVGLERSLADPAGSLADQAERLAGQWSRL